MRKLYYTLATFIVLVSFIFVYFIYLKSDSIDPKNDSTLSNQARVEKPVKKDISTDVLEQDLEYDSELDEIIDPEEVLNNELKAIQDEINDSDQESTEATVLETIGKKEPSLEDQVESLFSLPDDETDGNTIDVNIPQNNNSGLIGGVSRRTSAPSISNQVVSGINEEDNPELDPLETLPVVSGQARGYNMLYLMHPNARRTVNAQVEALQVAGLENIYLAVLIDGTFSKDFAFLRSVLTKLSTPENRITLVLYLTNGATMRRFDTTPISASFNRIDPDEFRDLIRFDPEIRNQFLSIAGEANAIFNFNLSLNATNENIAVMMLEDNLQFSSYQAMRDLAESVLGDDVQYYRNPCPGCWDGNDIAAGGDPIEYHNPFLISELNRSDGFTNDGLSYRFPNEAQSARTISFEDLRNFVSAVTDRDAKYFGLWRRERQGLYEAVPSIHPDERTYEVPSVNQLVEEVRLLREGLS